MRHGNDTRMQEVILTNHKRLYHRSAEWMQNFLKRLGYVSVSLELIKGAIHNCTCRLWERSTHPTAGQNANLRKV